MDCPRCSAARLRSSWVIAARRKLSKALTAARTAAQEYAEVEHAVAWLQMVGAGRVRPFGSPKPMLTPHAGPHGLLTATQALDALDALAAGELPEGRRQLKGPLQVVGG